MKHETRNEYLLMDVIVGMIIGGMIVGILLTAGLEKWLSW